MLTNRTLRTSLAALSGAFLLVAIPAVSQDQEAEPAAPMDEAISEEITVTALQVEEALQDVPATVSVLTEAQIEGVGVQRAEDFVKLVPGVSMVNAAEVGDTQVNIRGIDQRLARRREQLRLHRRRRLMTNPAAFNREYVDLRQIEVVKGPQGALYGRNAAAGAVIVTTQPPGDDFEGEAGSRWPTTAATAAPSPSVARWDRAATPAISSTATGALPTASTSTPSRAGTTL